MELAWRRPRVEWSSFRGKSFSSRLPQSVFTQRISNNLTVSRYIRYPRSESPLSRDMCTATESNPIARSTRIKRVCYIIFRAHRSRQPQTRFSAKCRSVGRRAASVRACGWDEGQSKDVAALPGPPSSEADAQKHFYPTSTTTTTTTMPPQPPNRRSGPLDLGRDLLHCAYY